MELAMREELDNEQGVIRLPVCLVKGIEDGPTLVAFAGVKGDEYEGMRAIIEVHDQLDPGSMKGNFIGVPVVNVPAFWSATRISPIDLKNLARTYPGRPDGTTSERIAYYSQEKIMVHANVFIDLHSGGRNTFLPLLCGYYNDGAEMGRVSREAAIIFGAPVVWEHDVLSPGRTIYESVKRGIPTLYTECRGGGHLNSDDLASYVSGLFNLLKYMRVLPEPPNPPGKQMFLGGSGDVDIAIASKAAGFFCPKVELLAKVARRQLLGEVTDLVGNVLEQVHANTDGIVELVRSTTRVFPGEILFLISQEVKNLADRKVHEEFEPADTEPAR
jgi:predicted deacylase